MPITVRNADGSVKIVSLKKTAAPVKPVVKPPPVPPAKDIDTLRAEFEIARERKNDPEAPPWSYAEALAAFNKVRAAIMKTQHPNLHRRLGLAEAVLRDEEDAAIRREQKNDHIARRLAIAEQVLALPDEEEYEPQSRSCYRCGGTYSHATKEDDDEDTGYCPDCLAKSAKERDAVRRAEKNDHVCDPEWSVDDIDEPNIYPYKKCSVCSERSSCGNYNDNKEWVCERCGE